MKQFTGFPARMSFTPVPNLFFTALLAQIKDINELKTTLHVFRVIYGKRGYPRFTTYRELLGDSSLMSGLEGAPTPEEGLRLALDLATRRGTLLRVALEADGTTEDAYFLNTEPDRRAVAKIQSGQLKPTGLTIKAGPAASTVERPDIFTLYEQNIGLLTPLVAEQLRDAERLYPQSWVIEAIKEAVNQNKRKISYILAILERWSAEGKGDGAPERDYKKTDPDKYIKGKYGHLVNR